MHVCTCFFQILHVKMVERAQTVRVSAFPSGVTAKNKRNRFFVQANECGCIEPPALPVCWRIGGCLGISELAINNLTLNHLYMFNLD